MCGSDKTRVGLVPIKDATGRTFLVMILNIRGYYQSKGL